MARPTSASTDDTAHRGRGHGSSASEDRGRGWDRGREGGLRGFLHSPAGRVGAVALLLGVLQAVLFYDHFAVALTLLFGLGLGFWLRTWKAALPALASFVVAYLLAVGTGWLHDARPIWEPLLGGMLAALGGVVGGGIFDVLRRDVDARASDAVTMDSF